MNTTKTFETNNPSSDANSNGSDGEDNSSFVFETKEPETTQEAKDNISNIIEASPLKGQQKFAPGETLIEFAQTTLQQQYNACKFFFSNC